MNDSSPITNKVFYFNTTKTTIYLGISLRFLAYSLVFRLVRVWSWRLLKIWQICDILQWTDHRSHRCWWLLRILNWAQFLLFVLLRLCIESREVGSAARRGGEHWFAVLIASIDTLFFFSTFTGLVPHRCVAESTFTANNEFPQSTEGTKMGHKIHFFVVSKVFCCYLFIHMEYISLVGSIGAGAIHLKISNSSCSFYCITFHFCCLCVRLCYRRNARATKEQCGQLNATKSLIQSIL